MVSLDWHVESKQQRVLTTTVAANLDRLTCLDTRHIPVVYKDTAWLIIVDYDWWVIDQDLMPTMSMGVSVMLAI